MIRWSKTYFLQQAKTNWMSVLNTETFRMLIIDFLLHSPWITCNQFKSNVNTFEAAHTILSVRVISTACLRSLAFHYMAKAFAISCVMQRETCINVCTTLNSSVFNPVTQGRSWDSIKSRLVSNKALFGTNLSGDIRKGKQASFLTDLETMFITKSTFWHFSPNDSVIKNLIHYCNSTKLSHWWDNVRYPNCTKWFYSSIKHENS